MITASERAWFARRGPGALVARITVPTLIVQGTVDTLFTLQEGVDNYQVLSTAGSRRRCSGSAGATACA